MAIDSIEAPSSPSPLPTQFSQSRHFYIAVDRLQFKSETLLDLLGVAGRKGLPMVLCCSSRDELDSVCSALSNLSYISFTSLYSDQAEAERAMVLEKFRQATFEWNQNVTIHSGNVTEAEIDDCKSCVVVVTDACLPHLTFGEAPILARVLINYEMPTKKETYLRRMSASLAADGIVINMIVGGEVVTLKNIEESSALHIAEMPINISEIL
ncbi:RNA helicase [Ranunculus cassubicifolius]